MWSQQQIEYLKNFWQIKRLRHHHMKTASSIQPFQEMIIGYYDRIFTPIPRFQPNDRINDLTLDMPNDISKKARAYSSTTINSIMCDVTQKADSNWRIRTERSFERRGSGDGSAVEHYPGERKLSIWFCKLKIKIMVLYHDFSTLLSRRWWWDILLYLSVNDSRSSIKVLIQC